MRTIENKLKYFAADRLEIGFGPIDLSAGEKKFYKGFNSEIISLCESLPDSIQLDARLFLMKYSGFVIGRDFFKNHDFFKNYYVPSWSIIYWLIRRDGENRRLTNEDIKDSKTAHAMAMKLHSLDDHINDKEIPATHLTLLLRSQSWMRMTNALKRLADGVDGGHEIVRGFIDDYYASICDPEETESLDGFCNRFRKQMATWLIVPVLMTKKMTTDKGFTDAVQIAYGSFGIAWKLLDDIVDIGEDMENGTHSSVYVCLPETKKKFWNGNDTAPSNNDACGRSSILNWVRQEGVIKRIQQRIFIELDRAASIFESHNMTGLAEELRLLLTPFNE